MSKPPASEESVAAGSAKERHGSTEAYVRETIRDAILTGRLSPGHRLVESSLTEEFGVSRSSVRTALGRLATEGLIDLVPNRGALVRRLRRKEIFDRYEIREQLEGLSASLAAQRLVDPERREAFRQAVTPLSETIFQVGARREENQQFHRAVAEASENLQLWEAIKRVSLPTEMVMLRKQYEADRGYWDKARAEHKGIAAAILDNNPELAGALMRSHVRRVREDFMKLPPSVFGID